jgi:hypothetical protein
MNPTRAIACAARVLAGLAVGLIALATISPAAFARPGPPSVTPTVLATPQPPSLPPGWNKHPPLPAHVHTLATSGMPGWQITLLAAGATVLTAVAVVLLARARAARRTTASAT